MNDNILDGIEPMVNNVREVKVEKKDYKNYVIIVLCIIIAVLILYIYFSRGKEEPMVIHKPPPAAKESPPKEMPEIDEKTEKEMAKKLTEEFPVEEEVTN